MQQEKWLTIYEDKLFYRVIGTGRPVVLLHGFGEDGNVWKEQIDFLKGTFTLIIPDLPGSGKSTLPPNVSMEAMADCVKALLDEEKITTVTVIGHSMGGYITLAFAEKYPALLKSFGLFHSSAYADSEEKKTARKKSIDFISTHGAYEFLKQSTPNLYGEAFKKENPAIITAFIEQYKNLNPAALVAYYEAMMARPDRTPVLENFVNPVLFVLGKNDNAIPFEDGLKQSHLPAIAFIHVLERSGHMGMLEETPKSNTILERFLQETA